MLIIILLQPFFIAFLVSDSATSFRFMIKTKKAGTTRICEMKGQYTLLLLLLLVTRPLPRDGNMVEDHEAPEAGQFSRAWTRGRREPESGQRVSSEKSP